MFSPATQATDARHVRKLSLRASRRGDIRKATISIEDALRTASFPSGDDGKLILIRKLELGRIAPNLSPTQLSLQIEKLAKSLQVQAVPFDRPFADRANVVIFPSRQQALRELTKRLLDRTPCTAWYWQKIVPQIATTRSDAPNLLPIVFSELLSEANAHLALGKILPQLIDRGPTLDLERLFPEPAIAGWYYRNQLGDTIDPTTVSASLPAISQATRRIIESIVVNYPPQKLRTHFLTILALSSEFPQSTSIRFLAQKARQAIRSASEARISLTRETNNSSTADQLKRESKIAHPSAEGLLDSSLETTPTTNHSEDKSLDRSGQADTESQTATDENPFLQFTPDKLATGYAGIVIVVAILNRLGFNNFLKRRQDELSPTFAAEFLIYLLQRLKAPADDAIAQLLTDRSNENSSEANANFDLWFAALRLWTKRRLKMSLAEVVIRRGFFHASDTHLDIYFDYSLADIRIRRQALDIDPGWTPFLNWVISIHYIDTHDIDA